MTVEKTASTSENEEEEESELKKLYPETFSPNASTRLRSKSNLNLKEFHKKKHFHVQ